MLTDEKINQKKMIKLTGEKLNVDSQIIFPFHLFSPTDFHNIYTDIVRCWVLRLKCDIIIDSVSNTILPITNISYIHYPFLNSGIKKNLINNLFFMPYKIFIKNNFARINTRMILSNSNYTKNPINQIFGMNAKVLYPPVNIKNLIPRNLKNDRQNNVVTISRIKEEKMLTMIPIIAKSVENVNFYIIGLLDSINEYQKIKYLINKLKLSNRVKILPNASRSELIYLLQNSKIYLHTMIGEHFGISIIEGMASGCIPIVHNSGGPREFVPRNLLYNNIEEAINLIKTQINMWSPEYVKNFINISKKFDVKHFTNNFIKLFYDYIYKYYNYKHVKKMKNNSNFCAREKNIIVISPHPDDELLACGGTIAKKISNLYNVIVVYMTDGKNTFYNKYGRLNSPSPNELKQIRKNESKKALKILGIKDKNIIFLEYPDGYLKLYKNDAEKKILKIFKTYRPSVIYYPSYKDFVDDHRETYHIIKKSIKKLDFKPIEYTYIIWRRFNVIGPTLSKIINYFNKNKIEIDIKKYMNVKILALNEYKSQIFTIYKYQKEPILQKSFIKNFLKEKEQFYIEK